MRAFDLRAGILALAAAAALGLGAAQAAGVVTPVSEQPKRVFYSGHSLLNQPIPGFIEQIARSKGVPVLWNRQHIEGSSIKARTFGSGDWRGYAEGVDRDGRRYDVRDEFATTRDGLRYDTLVVTEQHAILGSLVWHDTNPMLKHLADTFLKANPTGRIVVYDSWLNVDDPRKPDAWIAYERAARPIWSCIARRLSEAYRAEGRDVTVGRIPAAAALATLVERAYAPAGLPGVTRGTPDETFAGLFSDSVHLTPAGSYFVSLVAFGSLFGVDTAGAWHPDAVSPAAARSMQEVADGVLAQDRGADMSLADCRAYVRTQFMDTFFDYWLMSVVEKDSNWVMARVRKFRIMRQWRPIYCGDGVENPFAEPGGMGPRQRSSSAN